MGHSGFTLWMDQNALYFLLVIRNVPFNYPDFLLAELGAEF